MYCTGDADADAGGDGGSRWRGRTPGPRWRTVRVGSTGLADVSSWRAQSMWAHDLVGRQVGNCDVPHWTATSSGPIDGDAAAAAVLANVWCHKLLSSQQACRGERWPPGRWRHLVVPPADPAEPKPAQSFPPAHTRTHTQTISRVSFLSFSPSPSATWTWRDLRLVARSQPAITATRPDGLCPSPIKTISSSQSTWLIVTRLDVIVCVCV